MNGLKKFIISFISAVGMSVLFFGVTAFADDYSEAANLDISNNLGRCYSDINALREEGIRVFDAAKLMSDEERSELGDALDRVSEETGFDIAVFTASDISGYDSTGDFADSIYDNGGFGYGNDRSGTILVMETYGDGSAYISTAGSAVRYITDSGIDYIFDNVINGSGVWDSFQNGNYYNAGMMYAFGVTKLCKNGIQKDQYNYNTETGYKDYYYETGRGITFPEIFIALAISGIFGSLSVIYVKNNYSMRKEKSSPNGINQAYTAVSNYRKSADLNSRLLNRFVTTRLIMDDEKRGFGSDSHENGGGISSTHMSSGGISHGGGGRGSR